ncbi:MAG TPA: DUF58 domain-containing protein [Candidatus Faecivivens stercoripullorum]|uniref:DUF58 domain-containing protein n=1 Tax=Candidatus Faecivivens stercoripullorum TaxID=2840805 RepID=A0A9D1H8A3_9FIRM|nr:DUF58 domain-containing protein [Candidatus Faecivivens stercoripullorum]
MEFAAIAVVLVGLFLLQNQLYKQYAFKNIHYSCTLSCNECYEGDEIELIEEIVNRKWLPLPWLKAEITTSRWLSFAGAQSGVTGETRFVPSFFSVRGYSKVTRRWKVKALKRGEFSIEQVVLITTDLLGYSNLSMSGDASARILVLPRAIESSEITVRPRYLNGDIMVRRQLLDDPFYISGVRQYTGHEPMSRIHWPATAVMQQLMVYNNDFTSRQSVTIILNMQSRASEHMEVVDTDRMENAIRVCAGLFKTALTGMPTRFVSNAPLSMNGEDRKTPVTTGEYWGSEYELGLLELLARLQLHSTEDFGNFLAGMSAGITSTDIVIVSCYLSEAMLQFAAGRQKSGVHVRFFILGPIPEELDYEGFDVLPCVIDETVGRRALSQDEAEMQRRGYDLEKEAAV